MQQRWRWGGLLGCLLILGFWGTAEAQLKIGVVDLQAVLDNSIRGKAAKEQLRELGRKLQEEIQTKREFKEQREKELEKLRSEIRSQGLVLSEQARLAKEEEFRRQVRELKRFIADTNRFIEDALQEFREKEARETQRLIAEIRQVVQDLGKREGYSLILEGNETTAVVLYYGKAVDLTQKVIQLYDRASAKR
ncbi:MAG: outer membrane protein [Candidatus Tectimicrobiota bacterium]|nr:MAG: outer membrane protein [Candidatus Tectomicrobia bacterium]